MKSGYKDKDLTDDIYAWEKRIGLYDLDPTPDQLLTIEECRGIVGDVCKYVGLSGPSYVLPLDDRCKWRGAQCAYLEKALYFPEWALQLPFILHELAHWLPRQGHSKKFVEWFIFLLDLYGVRQKWELEVTAEECGIL